MIAWAFGPGSLSGFIGDTSRIKVSVVVVEIITLEDGMVDGEWWIGSGFWDWG
jgi:hypothetical protein